MPAVQMARASSKVQRVFISYKRNVEPDQTLAGQVLEGLTNAGHTVFIDERLSVGQAWAREIEAQVSQSDFLVVFLTAESSHGEMVRGEIEIAHRQAASGTGPRILPVRLAFDGALPYPLNAYLDGIQYATWNDPGDTTRVLDELRAVIAGDQPAGDRFTCAGAPASTSQLPPPYAAPLPVPGGPSTWTIPGIWRGRPMRPLLR